MGKNSWRTQYSKKNPPNAPLFSHGHRRGVRPRRGGGGGVLPVVRLPPPQEQEDQDRGHVRGRGEAIHGGGGKTEVKSKRFDVKIRKI